jgi:hypothetical protein
MAMEKKTISEEIKSWIEAASVDTGLQVSIIPDAEAQELIALIIERYVKAPCGWWWDQLKVPYVHFDSQTVRLSEILPSLEGEVYLIPEYPHLKGPVFRVKAREVEAILDDSPFFEYSIVDKHADWLVTESHHRVIFLCRWGQAGWWPG